MPNMKKQKTECNTAAHGKTRAAIQKQLIQNKSEVLTPILKSRLGNRSDSQKDGRQ
jgi:hypothetical protein